MAAREVSRSQQLSQKAAVAVSRVPNNRRLLLSKSFTSGMTNKSMSIERIPQSNDRIIHPYVGMIEHPARSRYFTPYPILSALFSSQLSRRIKILIGLIKVQNAVVVCAPDAQRISYGAKPISRGWAHVFAIFFGVQAMFALGLVAAAHAGPCTKRSKPFRCRSTLYWKRGPVLDLHSLRANLRVSITSLHLSRLRVRRNKPVKECKANKLWLHSHVRARLTGLVMQTFAIQHYSTYGAKLPLRAVTMAVAVVSNIEWMWRPEEFGANYTGPFKGFLTGAGWAKRSFARPFARATPPSARERMRTPLTTNVSSVPIHYTLSSVLGRPVASRISFAISSGFEINDKWLAFTSIVLAPMRLAMKRSKSGFIVRSSIETA